MDERVLTAMQPYFSERFYNPSASYGPARDVLADLDQARARVAHHLGARSSEIIFTSGGTEANNLAIRGVMDQYTDKRILTSSIEHESVLGPSARYQNHKRLPVDERGIVDLGILREQIDDQTVLVSIMQANNEIGSLQPLTKVSVIIKEVRADRRKRKVDLPLYFHTDSTQAANYHDLHVHRLGVDMMTLNGGKVYGPKGAGALFVNSIVVLSPQIVGGGQQRGLRAGTENVAGAIGLARALELVQDIRVQESSRLSALRSLMIENLKRSIPGIIINGSSKYRLPNNIHITIPGQDNERLLILLEAQGIYAAAGSACSANTQAASHVLHAIGLSEADARSSLRFTLGRSTAQADIEHTASVLAGLLKST